MISRRTLGVACHSASLSPALRLAILWLVLLCSAQVSAQGAHVIEAGRESDIQALFAPHGLGDELPGGFAFETIAIEAESIRIGVSRDESEYFASLSYPDRGGERVGSFAVRIETSEAEPRAALEQLLSALRQNDDGEFWHVVAAPASLTDTAGTEPDIPGARPVRAMDEPREILLPQLVHLLAALATLFGLAIWIGRRRARWALVFVVAGAILAWTIFMFTATSPSSIPIDAISGLQEGLTLKVLNMIAGHGVHGGINLDYLSTFWSGAEIPLRTRIWIDAWLAGVGVLVFAGIAQAVLRNLGFTLLATLVFLTAPSTALAATSESPASFMALYFFAGAIIAAGLHAARSTMQRRALILALLPPAYLLVTTRIEWLAVALMALGVAILLELARRPSVAETVDRVLLRLKTLAKRPATWTLVLLLLLAWPLSRLVALPGSWQDALSLLALPIWRLPSAMVRMAGFIPALLMLGGLLYGAYRWRRTLLLPIPVVVLFLAYVRSAHNGQASSEMARYLTLLMPPLFVLMLVGWRGLERWAEHAHWASWWRWCAPAIVIPAVLATIPAPNFQWRMVGVQQSELRYLVRALEEHPQCAFVTPVANEETVGGPADLGGGRWAVFGNSRELETMPREGATAADALQRFAPDADCRLLYRSTTCSLVGAPPCFPPAIHEQRLDAQILSNVSYYMHIAYEDPVEVYLVPLSGEDR